MRGGIYSVRGFGVVQEYGECWMHEGIDIKSKSGATVVAPAAGTVEKVSGFSGTKTVLIQHGNDVTTSYSNLETITVIAGKSIERGAKIGVIGKKALFYQVLVEGVPVDPLPYILAD